MTWGKRVASLAAVLCAVVAAFPGSAAPWTNADTVRLGFCAANGDVWTVSAGVPLNVRVLWSAKTNGLFQDFLNDTSVTVTAGGSTFDLKPYFDPVALDANGLWSAASTPRTGLVMQAGQQMVFTLVIGVRHALPDIVDPSRPNAPPALLRPGAPIVVNCLVTAV